MRSHSIQKLNFFESHFDFLIQSHQWHRLEDKTQWSVDLRLMEKMEVSAKDNLLKSFASNAEFLPPDGDMFSKPLMEWEDLPVVHIQGDFKPTQESAPKTRALIDRLLPMIKGKEGYYGAGGGPLYLMFFSGSLEDGKWSKDNIPTCDFILEKLSVSSAYRKYLEWFAVLDITHQTMFPRQSSGASEEELVLQIEAVISEVDPQAPVLGEFSASPYLPDYIFESFPRASLPRQLRMLHMGIYCEGIHDADCAKSCPRDSSMITSRGTLLPDSRVIRYCGDIYSNPRLALFQTSEGHILGLISLDYLD
jgi:hypothetical protein